MRRPPAPTRWWIPRSSQPLRALALASALAAPALLAFAPSASAHLLTVQSGSPSADKISNLYTITLVIAVVIFVIVEGALLYSLIRFRKRKGRVAAQIHGNTRLEIGWTLGATAILVALAVLTFAELSSIRDPPNSGPGGLDLNDGSQYITTGAATPPDGKAITIQVNGQQYIWRYIYLNYGTQPDGLDDPYTFYDMVVPVDTVIKLKVVSQDVTHSFWIPDLVPKLQAVPGYTNYTWFEAPRVGNYYGQCAFLCGIGHARMKAEITVVSPKAFLKWVHNLKTGIAASNAAQAKSRAAQKGKSLPTAVEVR